MIKSMSLLSIMLFLITSPIFGELSKQDIEEFRSIVKESETRLKEHIDNEIKQVKEHIDNEIKHVKEHIDNEIKHVKEHIDLKIETVNAEIEGVRKQLIIVFGFVIALVGLIGVAIGLPHVIDMFQRKKLQLQSERAEEPT